MIKTLLTSAGFTDIVENKDGTIDATKDGFRYTKMYISGHDMGKSENVMTQDVVMIMSD